ncbi:MAG: DUF1580 domain-containing protein [Candidatus Anammoximicrobium sp.]|nr:DUF1580 domain-containing protein [Candidatus Anammoximicrobium sp.]
MSIDISRESLLTLTEAAKTLPTRPAISSLHRWRLRGVRGVKLETALLGGRRVTSREALERFAAAVTNAAEGDPAPVRTPRQRAQEIAAAERKLGIRTQL